MEPIEIRPAPRTFEVVIKTMPGTTMEMVDGGYASMRMRVDGDWIYHAYVALRKANEQR